METASQPCAPTSSSACNAGELVGRRVGAANGGRERIMYSHVVMASSLAAARLVTGGHRTITNSDDRRRRRRTAYRYGAGSTVLPLMRTSKCRWGPVEKPVLPM